jgi:Family of unknown function (DUF6352)
MPSTPPPRHLRQPWPAAGLAHLVPDARGWLRPAADWWRAGLAQPELALVAESCPVEHALHQRLGADPLAPVSAADLTALADADVRENWSHWLAWRDGVQQAGSLQGWYRRQFAGAGVQVPPAFLDATVQAVVAHLLASGADAADALAWRTGELFFRTQRVVFEQGRVLAADALTAAELGATQGLGSIGRLLAQAQIDATRLDLPVLGPDSAERYWVEAARTPFHRTLLLDLTQQISQDIGHGVALRLAHGGSALKPLARLLQAWVLHFTGAAVRISPADRVADEHWRWHVGLDAEASALLNDLYAGLTVAPERLARLIGLFTLVFDDPADMHPDVAGRPVYLALAADSDGRLRLKPQNLLLNLPLHPGRALPS